MMQGVFFNLTAYFENYILTNKPFVSFSGDDRKKKHMADLPHNIRIWSPHSPDNPCTLDAIKIIKSRQLCKLPVAKSLRTERNGLRSALSDKEGT